MAEKPPYVDSRSRPEGVCSTRVTSLENVKGVWHACHTPKQSAAKARAGNCRYAVTPDSLPEGLIFKALHPEGEATPAGGPGIPAPQQNKGSYGFNQPKDKD